MILLNNKNIPLITLSVLFIIMLFGVYLRYEDFPDWKKNPHIFSYQGEYQMATPDGYYFLQHAKDLANKTYTTVDEKRYFPHGEKRPAIPPLLSVLIVTINKISKIPLATAAIFVPIFLSVLIVPVVYALARIYQMERIPALLASFFSMISLTYVARTKIGVFDTDCLIAVLLLLNSYLVMRFVFEEKKYRYYFLGAAFLNTFIFYTLWDNAHGVVLTSLAYLLSLSVFFFFRDKSWWLKSGVICALFLPVFIFFGKELFDQARLSLAMGAGAFPPVTIAEHKPVTWTEFIEKTSGHIFLMLIILSGLLYLLFTNF